MSIKQQYQLACSLLRKQRNLAYDYELMRGAAAHVLRTELHKVSAQIRAMDAMDAGIVACAEVALQKRKAQYNSIGSVMVDSRNPSVAFKRNRAINRSVFGKVRIAA